MWNMYLTYQEPGAMLHMWICFTLVARPLIIDGCARGWKKPSCTRPTYKPCWATRRPIRPTRSSRLKTSDAATGYEARACFCNGLWACCDGLCAKREFRGLLGYVGGIFIKLFVYSSMITVRRRRCAVIILFVLYYVFLLF